MRTCTCPCSGATRRGTPQRAPSRSRRSPVPSSRRACCGRGSRGFAPPAGSRSSGGSPRGWVSREGPAALRPPGRLEIVVREPPVVVDGAHNPAGAEALATAVGEFFRWERLHVVLAVSKNKDIEGVVGPIAAIADVIYATRNDSVRSAEPDDVARVARAASSATVEVSPSVGDALAAARATAGRGDLVLVTGSLFTVGDAKRALAGA